MNATAAITKRVDHIMIRVVEAAYNPLLTLLTQTLQLPLSWPVNNDTPGFKTGGVFAGTISMEIFQSGTRQMLSSPTPAQAQLYGIAFEPYGLERALQDVDRRGIPHLPLVPVPEGRPQGTLGSMWTLLFFGDFLGGDLADYATAMQGARDLTPFFDQVFPSGVVFLCEYNQAFCDTTQRRLDRQDVLQGRQGGPLGLLGTQEIIVGVKEMHTAHASWQRLFDPLAEVAAGAWQVGDGPMIRLMPHHQDALLTLVWNVTSLERAAAFLRAQGLLGSYTKERVTLDHAKLYGLDIQLVE